MRESGKAYTIEERLPPRSIEIHTPNEYSGFKSHDHSNSCEDFSYLNRNYFINGFLNATDGTFLSGFYVSDIDKTNIVIGPYPLYPIDIDQIS